MRKYINLSKLTLEMKQLKLEDGRPAYIFVPYEGQYPLIKKVNGKEFCPYCSTELANKSCSCYAYQKAVQFNAVLEAT